MVRDFLLPAWSVGGESDTKFSLLAQNASKMGISGVLGEFCTGWARRGASRESFVPTPAPRAVQSSPCLVWWWVRARKSSPSARKMPQKWRFMACRANFFAETPVEAPCRVKFFAGEPAKASCRANSVASGPEKAPCWTTFVRHIVPRRRQTPTSRAPAPREKGKLATAWCRRRILTPRPQPTRSG